MTTSGTVRKSKKKTVSQSKTNLMSGQNFTSQLCEIIKTCGESGIAHFSMRCDDIDVEFVMNGNVALNTFK